MTNQHDSNDDRPTYRERRLAKAERLRGWADGRDAKADAAHANARAIGDMIPFGQPILVGHHSEGRHRRDLARMTGGMDKATEHASKARDMRSRAGGIEAAAEHAIYSDDPDAAERLAARIAELEARRDSNKSYNRSCKQGAPDVALLISERDRDSVTNPAIRDFCTRPDGSLRVGLSNLTADIARNRKRLEAMTGDTR